jgi:ATP-dependent Lon protease
MAVYEVPAPTPEQAAGIAQRMYAGLLKELNLAAFDPRLGDVVLDKLAGVSPRDLRKTLLDGLGYAVAAGREHVVASDIRVKATPGKGRIGF